MGFGLGAVREPPLAAEVNLFGKFIGESSMTFTF